jgi:DNA-binding response OmpR family regulator
MPVSKLIRKVLIADDEHVIADTLAMIFTRHGFQATAVYSGEQAVQTALLSAPDLLIADVAMDGITGIDAGVQIRRCAPDCLILLISGHARSEDLPTLCDGAPFEMFVKPVHPQILLDRVYHV